MPSRRVSNPEEKFRGRRPATTPEGREDQLVALAIDLAERQLSEGTASAQVISHYLKLGSSRERLEQQLMENNNKLMEAKIEHLASAKRVEELYAEALEAMRAYSGQEPMDAREDFDD